MGKIADKGRGVARAIRPQNSGNTEEVLRQSYKKTWNSLSQDIDSANYFVSCIEDEDEVRANGESTANFLRKALHISQTDQVLEIGCGVARIGRELAPHCGEWHGCDISGNMIEFAKQRTSHLPNVSLTELPTNDLSPFADQSFDAVYSTIVFMHIDKPDVYKYICEAFRVLRPGGIAYFDTYNLLAPRAWEIFEQLVDEFSGGERPRHMSQFSCPQEFEHFVTSAGFVNPEINDKNPELVTARAHRPQHDRQL